MNLRRILCCCLILSLLCGIASAYIISFTIPRDLDAGTPLVVQGESNLPAGATVETQLYRDVPNFQSVLVATLPATIRANGSWEVTYDTTGFMSGTYKVQVLRSADYPYGSSSVQLRTLTITGATPAPTTASPAATAFTPSPPPSPGQTIKEVNPEPTGSPAPVALIIPGLGIGAALLSLRRR